MHIASSDDETLVIYPNILDVVANLPPKNEWTEHLVEYPVIAGAANVNRFLNSTVSQGSTLAVFRYPEHPRFSDGIPDSLAQ